MIYAVIGGIAVGVMGLIALLLWIRLRRKAAGKPVIGDGHWLKKWKNRP